MALCDAPEELRHKLYVMIEVALEASTLVLPLFHSGCERKTKSDGSIVTIADTQGEALIARRLTAAFPGIAILGEESVSDGVALDLGDSYFCVDPIDGTKQFASGNPEWVICVGYLEHGRPVAGVIVAPAMGNRLFAGLSDFGGFELLADGSRKPFERQLPNADPVRVLRGGHDSKASIKEFLPASQPVTIKKLGSALKFALIAAGEADLFIRSGRVWDWDIAAGQALIEAAGGAVVDVSGAALKYGQVGQGYRHAPFKAFGGGLVSNREG